MAPCVPHHTCECKTRGESLAWVILATVAALAGLGLLLLGH